MVDRFVQSRKKRKISPSIDLMAPHPVASSSTKYQVILYHMQLVAGCTTHVFFRHSQGIASDDSDHGRLLTIRLPVKRKRLLSHSSDEDVRSFSFSLGAISHALHELRMSL